ncbi:MAG: aminomethyl transferase family protein [bacterium]|nr:aminomethyl transferase family protein [bacterium]
MRPENTDEDDTMAIGTPFFPRTAELNKSLSWREWSGYFAADHYCDFHQPEYAAIRNGAALIDVSPLYKYRVQGPDARAMIDRVFTRSAQTFKVGQVIYTPWCDEEGKVLQEGTVMRLAKDHYQVNAAEPAIRWLRLTATGLRVEIEDTSTRTAALAVQGPRSRALLSEVAGSAASELGFFRLMKCEIGGVEVVVTRTGYTGELGYELWIPAAETVRVWDALMIAGQAFGATPCGLMAMDVARIEAGFILIDVDYISAENALIPSQKSSPFELGLDWAVKLRKKAPFIGREALEREKRDGSAWRLVGLEIPWEPLEELYLAAGLMPDLPTVAWREAVPVYADGRQVGRATSGCWSTLLKKYIALASVQTPYSRFGTELGMEVTVDYARRQAPARVVEPVFFRSPLMRE